MRKYLLLALVFFISCTAFAQDFSNKGKEFWTCFPNHIPSGANGQMTIWITSDQASNGVVSITNGSFSAPFNVAANGIVPINIPYNLAHLSNAESGIILQKSIKIAVNPGQPAIVAYAQQYGNARSAATLLLPTNVLGKKYRASSFTHTATSAGGQNSRSQFQIIATQPNTQVEVTPYANGVQGTKFTIVFPNTGDIYQYQASADVTGTLIESIASGSSGCLPIAVFSGNSAVTIGTPTCNGNSYDPLFQQLYPITTWGKNFGFIPFGDYNGNPYRVMASEDATRVFFNGSIVATLNAGQIYPAAFTSNPVLLTQPTSITADKPICVTQYLQTSACSGSNNGDPDMVVLNPIEQNIKDITVFASTQQNINRQWINVLIQTTAAASFKIDGVPPTTAFVPAANIPGYSYLRHMFNPAISGSHLLTADSGFNAILYGYQQGQFESYAYSAGTNVRDLTQQLELATTYGIETSPSVCTNSPFVFKVYFPDSTLGTTPVAIRFDSLRWNLRNPGLIVPNNFPIMVYGSPAVPIDSTNVRNGRQVNWYSLPTTYYYNTAGRDTLLITGYKSTNEGCGSTIEYEFPLQVSDPPTASFNAIVPGCYAEPVLVNETTPQLPKTTYRQWWEFYDPVTNATTVFTNSPPNPPGPIRSVSHTFTTPGTKRIRHASITTPGCLSDTIVQFITLPDIPNATIVGNTTVCINSVVSVPVTFTGTEGTAPYTFTYTINGGAPLTITSPGATATATIAAPANVAGTFIYNLVGVRNASPVGTPCTRNITGQSVTVNITPDATVTLTSAPTTNNQTVCINNPIVNITYAVGGSGNGGSVSGLPAGVSGTYAGGVITIIGTPIAPGIFNYTVSTTGPCITPQALGTITVTDDGTIALTSGPGTDNQTLCINTPILTNITYAVGGSGTGGSVTGLPAGVTGVYTGGVITISGTPTVSGVFNYTVTTTGPCIKPSATGSITVTANATLTLTSAVGTDNQTRCLNVAIINITYAVGGTGTGGSVSGLPAGVTGVYAAGIVTISGTPTAPGIFNYTVSTTGPCVIPQALGTITVTDDGTLALTSGPGTDNQTLCINTPILTNITYAVGGSGTGGSVTGLPAGVTGVYAGGVITISGTPTVSGVFNYTVTTTGPCVKPSATGSITVTANATLNLTSAVGTDNQTRCINVAITNITYAVGGTGTGGSVSGLPAGVTGVFAGGVITISGTPTASGTFNYTVSTTGPCVIPQAFGSITVTQDATLVLSSLAGTDAQKLCRNSAITNITYAVGGSGTGGSVTGLPAGVTGIYAGGIITISGIPTVSGLFNYTVTTTGPCVKPSLTGTILVDELPTPAFSYTIPTCDTRTITFTDNSVPNTGTIATWSWDFGDPASIPNNTSNAPNPTHVFTAANTTPGYNVTLTVTTSEGCSNAVPFSRIVTVNHRPVAGFIVPDVCINDVATPFIDTSKIAVGAITRTANEWNYGDPFATPGNPNTFIGRDGLHLYTATGIYQVTQIVTSSLGCRDTIVLPITINSADPVSNFNVTNSCSSDSVDLVNLSTVGFGNVTRIEIQWDFIGNPGAVQTITAPAFNGIYRHKYPTLQTTQTYTVRMVAYSGVICSNVLTKTVTVYATPIVQFNNIPASCLLVAPFQITQGSEIGGVPGTGTYSGPGITNPNGTFNPQIAGVGTHAIKYTFTASNPGACIDTLTRFITVRDTAHAKFSVVLPSCEQVPTIFTNLSTAPAGVTLVSAVWNFGDGPPQTFGIAAPVTHTYANPGPYTVTMYTVDNNTPTGCLSTDTSALINIDANHHITWDATSGNQNQPLCVNTSITPIRYRLSGGATNVNFIPALPAGLTYTVGGTPLTVTIQGAPTVPGGYTFGVQTTGNTCTNDNASVTISVAPDHAIALRAGSDTAQSVCLNTPIDDIYYDLSGGATGVTVSGLPAGVNYAVNGNELRIYGTPTSIPATPGFTITTTGNTCLTASKIGEIVVHPYPVPAFTVDKTSYCIPNAIVKFTNGSNTPNGAAMTYLWDFGDLSPTVTSVSPTHWYTRGVGPFIVTLTATSIAVPILNGGLQGCVKALPVPMTSIHPQPKADFVFSRPSVCIGDQITITDATDGIDGIVNEWHWDLGDGTNDVRLNPVNHTYADTITYVITMYTVNNFGCNSDTINKLPLVGAPYKPFTVYPYPHVNAGNDKSVLEGGSVMLDATAFANNAQYTWTPNLYLTDANALRPRVVSPKTDMTYRLTVKGSGGCELSDNVFVKLLKFPVIPNTFTPNNDGRNDKWVISFLNTYPNNRVQIFTRSGNLVFESRGYNTPWDGTLKGKPLPFDTYYYIIEPGNGRDPITGYVTIIK